MSDDKSPKSLLHALLEFQRVGVSVPRTKTGQVGSHKYKYAPLESILDAVRPPLLDLGCLLGFETVPTESPAFVTIRTTLVHVETGEARYVDVSATAGSGKAQEVGAAITYCSRYGVNLLLALTIEDDTDGAETSKRREAPPAQLNAKQELELNGLLTDIAKAEDLEAITHLYRESEEHGKTLPAGQRALIRNRVVDACTKRKTELSQ